MTLDVTSPMSIETFGWTGDDTCSVMNEAEIMAFCLTDFLVRPFDDFIWQPLRFDRYSRLLGMSF